MRVSERGQITIPKHLRERFGMNHNVEIEITPTERGLLIRKRTTAEHPVDRVYGILGKDALARVLASTTTSKRFGEGDHRRRHRRPAGCVGPG